MTMLERTETEILAPVVAHLAAHSWEVYAEVPVVLDGSLVSIDIVATRDGIVRVVEGKRRLDPTVVDQAKRWRRLAHQVYAVVGEPRRKTVRHNANRGELDRFGVGLVYVSEAGALRHQIEAKRQPAADPRVILAALCDAQQAGPAAGSAAARRVTPDRWDDVRSLLEREGRSTAKEIALGLGWSKADRRVFIKAAESDHGIRGIDIVDARGPYQFERSGGA